jgi:hypothetical protein
MPEEYELPKIIFGWPEGVRMGRSAGDAVSLWCG